MILIKTKEQIKGIRCSGALAAATLDYLVPFIRPEITTKELNDLAARFIKDHGAIPACLNYRGFPSEICISINEEICHGIPGPRKLKNGDIVKIDITTILNGYYGDTCRTYPVGEIDDKAHNLIVAAKQCMVLGIQRVRDGAYFGDIGIAVRKYADAFGYSVVHQFNGHGVGICFHEDPSISYYSTKKYNGPIMKSGMIFTIEPMICIGNPDAKINETDHWTASTKDSSLSAQFEHTILCTKNGHEILTMP